LQLLDEREGLANGLIQREQDVDSHNLVIKTLEQQEPTRRAWRLVGDVMVESTVEEVLPATQKNRDNLATVAQSMRKQLEAKSKEVLAFQEKYKIRVKDEGNGGGAPAAAAAGGSNQGVLVSGT
jgi:prefoldin subunit 2